MNSTVGDAFVVCLCADGVSLGGTVQKFEISILSIQASTSISLCRQIFKYNTML